MAFKFLEYRMVWTSRVQVLGISKIPVFWVGIFENFENSGLFWTVVLNLIFGKIFSKFLKTFGRSKPLVFFGLVSKSKSPKDRDSRKARYFWPTQCLTYNTSKYLRTTKYKKFLSRFEKAFSIKNVGLFGCLHDNARVQFNNYLLIDLLNCKLSILTKKMYHPSFGQWKEHLIYLRVFKIPDFIMRVAH